MDAANLRQALSFAGYHLNYRILNILVHRYGNKRGVITFNDFIMCAIRLKAMIGKNCVGVVTQHHTTRMAS
jgi:calpain